VFTDLEAYICTFRGCQFSLATFPTRELWAAHEFHVHRSTKIWACSECPLKFPTSDNLAQHLQTRHSLVHVGPELQIALLAAERVENGECPFCLKTTSGKQRDFVSHVAKHMEAVALMALPKDSESDIENSLQSKSDEELEEETPDESFKMVGRSSLEIDNAARDHPLYQNVTAQADGFYHCPWEGQDGCQHKPEKLKCNYEYAPYFVSQPLGSANHLTCTSKFVDSHLKPYRCKVLVCESLHFSSPACLLRHEREAHAMHGHGEKPFLCTYEGCERGIAGNGFPRHWNLRDHMKRVHNEPGLPKSSVSSNVGTVGSNVNPPPRPTKGKKRRGGQYDIYSAA
jgi:hypothetical protein